MDIQKLKNEGFLVIYDFLDSSEIEQVKAECAFLRECKHVIDRPGDSKVGFSTPRIVKHGLMRKTRMMGSIVKTKRMLETATEYFGEPCVICNVSSIVNTPNQGIYDPEQWHCDASKISMERADIRTLKFHIYLSDVDQTNGAFAFAERTHSLVTCARELMIEGCLPLKAIFLLSDLLSLESELRQVLPEHLLGELDRLKRLFPDGRQPIEDLIVRGKAGTAIIFDDAGFHCGGHVETGERVVVRYDFMTRQVRHWQLSTKELMVRGGLSRTLPHPIRHII